MNPPTLQPPRGKVERFLLLRRIRWMAAIFIGGLVLSGLTAVPLETELALARRALTFLESGQPSAKGGLAARIERVHTGVRETNERPPFTAYGTDRLAFGQLMIARAMMGVWRDPVRHVWVWWFAGLACLLVIPWSLGFGALRGTPWGWRLVDCWFGVAGLTPAGLGLSWTRRLAAAGR